MARNAHAKKEKIRARRLVEQQAERRKNNVYRFEVTFSVAEPDQVLVADHLVDLPRGGASSFIREAAFQKIALARFGVDDPVSQIEALYEELDFMRRRNEELHEALFRMVQALPTAADHERGINKILDRIDAIKIRAVQAFEVGVDPTPPRPNTLPEVSGMVQSSGIDMSRGRPRPKLKPGKVVKQEEPEEWTEEMMRQKGYEMAMSIKNAVPGRQS